MECKDVYKHRLSLFIASLVGLPGLARVRLSARTLKNIKALVVKIQTKITAIVSQSWLDVDFYIIRLIVGLV
jgi:hypothetical protein